MGAILLFAVWIIAVLQGWSKSTPCGRLIGVGFIVMMGLAAAWGVRTLTGVPRW